ncbi:MAG: RagB/SusD family nutrient uptake outer membrane protein [Saprospiraceae bacterium]
MKIQHKLTGYFALLLCLAFLTGCEIDDQTDPNGPSLNSVANNASRAELNLLVGGIEASARNGIRDYATATGTIARELYLFNADPRNTGDLLGQDDLVLDNNSFYLTFPYNGRYRAVKNCNVLLNALDNTSVVTETQKDGFRGYANMVKAQMLSEVLDLMNNNGIRIDVNDPTDLGGFVGKEEAYTQILATFDLAIDQLQGSEFIFNLSSGYDGFDTPAGMIQVANALAARTATRAGRYDAALRYITGSFIDADGDLSRGPDYVFSTSAGDILNPLFKNPGQSGDQIIVNPDVIADIRDGDTRFSKFGLRTEATSQNNLNGDYETRLYANNLSPINIIRNEELILIRAEARIQAMNFGDAIDDLNVIRNAYGLGDYDGPSTFDALIDEMLYQRRYSFWSEGHRMFDLRRYNRLNSDFLPIDRPGDDIFTQFPIPLSEGV